MGEYRLPKHGSCTINSFRKGIELNTEGGGKGWGMWKEGDGYKGNPLSSLKSKTWWPFYRYRISFPMAVFKAHINWWQRFVLLKSWSPVALIQIKFDRIRFANAQTHTHILFDEISIWFGNQYAHISTIWTRSLTQFIWLFISIGTLFSTPHHTHPMAIHRTAMACRILNPSNQTDLLWNTGADP